MTAENFHFRVPGLSDEIFLVVIEQSLIKMGQMILMKFEESLVITLMIVGLHPFYSSVYTHK